MLISTVQQSDPLHNMYIVFGIGFLYDLSQDIEYSSMCYTVGPCPSTLHLLTPNSQSIPSSTSPSTATRLSSVSLFLLCQWVQLCCILDFTCKWCHMVLFFSSWLISLSMITSSCIHVATNGIISFLLWLSSIPLYMCTTFSLSTRLSMNRWTFSLFPCLAYSE